MRERGSDIKRVLIVNCYFDDSHRRIARPRKVPHAMGPVYLAGAFSAGRCDVRLYDEVSSGALQDPGLLSWPDILVLTGLTNAFDRMLQVTAYARTKNPRVIVVAGGPAIRALPLLSRRFFDYACLGDVEELTGVIADSLGPAFVAERMLPRYDLAYWMGRIGHVETSRYCNFRCAFCALTAEGRPYRSHVGDDIALQFQALGPRKHVLFIDNNFYGNDRQDFLARVALVKERRDAGQLGDWAALVTGDFFAREDNLALAREAGCRFLFSGVESFDPAWLRRVNKRQNVVLPQVSLIARCLEAGIGFAYGLILDVTARPVADLRAELDFIAGTPAIPLPSFLTLSIPILGTPFFHECLRRGAFLPRTKLRDMDGTTIVISPRDPLDEVVGFLRDVVAFRGYRRRAVQHSIAFARRYRSTLDPVQMVAAVSTAALLGCDRFATTRVGLDWCRASGRRRTHVTTTEALDDVYTPAFRVAAGFEKYFRPTFITDEAGNVASIIAQSGLLDRIENAAQPSTTRTVGRPVTPP